MNERLSKTVTILSLLAAGQAAEPIKGLRFVDKGRFVRCVDYVD